MLLEIDEHVVENTNTFFDYEVKINKLIQENLYLKMQLEEIENEILRVKINSLEKKLRGNSAENDVFFGDSQKEIDSTIYYLYNELQRKYHKEFLSTGFDKNQENKKTRLQKKIIMICEILQKLPK